MCPSLCRAHKPSRPQPERWLNGSAQAPSSLLPDSRDSGTFWTTEKNVFSGAHLQPKLFCAVKRECCHKNGSLKKNGGRGLTVGGRALYLLKCLHLGGVSYTEPMLPGRAILHTGGQTVQQRKFFPGKENIPLDLCRHCTLVPAPHRVFILEKSFQSCS